MGHGPDEPQRVRSASDRHVAHRNVVGLGRRGREPELSIPPPAAARAARRAGGLIDCEEDRTLRAVIVGMLREADR